MSRRRWMAATVGLSVAAATSGGVVGPVEGEQAATRASPAERGFRYCLNTATIRGQKLSLPDQIAVAADAGYSGIEPWVGDLQEHVKSGRSLDDVAKQLRDRGLAVPSSIAFFPWIVEDATQRARGLEQAKREMDLARRIGAARIAAPPAGARDGDRISLSAAAERYRALLELGVSMGIVSQLELWGFSKVFSRLGEAVCIAMESGHPQACLLLDVFHIYKGGSDFHELRFVNGRALHVLHMNDYPARPPRAEINDGARVFPGDGVAPLSLVLRTLHEGGFDGFLSLEVFNRDYWRQDAHLVARTGLQKMRRTVELALAGNAPNS
ncbi:MAG TPA: sugar phosphate isomerase/epimerase [Planctomycetaceae bacterium]|nr:sugar phosphate isomerase/epimerase [Planctomycetaceae bacterium]